MLNSEHLIQVARISGTFGSNGEISVRLNSMVSVKIKREKPVFIYFDGLPVPFFIEKLEHKGTDKLILKLEGIENLRLAEKIVGEYLFLESKSAKSKDSEIDLVGFRAIEVSRKLSGVVTNFYDFPNNPCLGLKLIGDATEKLLPFNESFIKSIDVRKREIEFESPDGLFTL